MKIRMVKQATRRSGVPCFSIVKNESYFLPHLLDHYRGLGFGHFIFYDDGSTDGSREMLLAEEDCTLLDSEHHFQEKMPNGQPFHYVARSAIPEHLVKGRWCLTVDADEFLLLPQPLRTIEDVIVEMERRGHKCALAPMVDFYPERLSLRHFDAAVNPFKGVQWYFDREPGFARQPGSADLQAVAGGVRVRLMLMLAARFPDVYDRVFADQNLPKGQFRFAKLWKVPLVKTGHGITRRDTHSVDVATPDDIQLALAHFKFYPRLDQKVREALETRSYFKQSLEYRFLDAVLECLDDDNLISANSVRYTSPLSVEQAGLMYVRPASAAASAARG